MFLSECDNVGSLETIMLGLWKRLCWVSENDYVGSKPLFFLLRPPRARMITNLPPPPGTDSIATVNGDVTLANPKGMTLEVFAGLQTGKEEGDVVNTISFIPKFFFSRSTMFFLVMFKRSLLMYPPPCLGILPR